MSSTRRNHLVICLLLGLLAIPVYYLDHAIVGQGGGSNWITLDFRGLIFWSYVIFVAIEIALSSTAVRLFPKLRTWQAHLGAILVSPILLVAGFAAYGHLQRLELERSYQASVESRKTLLNVIELKKWSYSPDDIHPTEIRVSVIVHDSGRFAGNVTASQTDPSGSSQIVFESTDESERQRQVSSGEAFDYVFPLRVLHAGHSDNVRITLYLFKAGSGPAPGDIAKIFINSPQQDDDGEFFYGRLPAPSRSDSTL
jgi:hypothetical protein